MFPEGMEAYFQAIMASNGVLAPLFRLNNPEESIDERSLSWARSAHNGNLLPLANVEANIMKNQRIVVPIFQVKVINLNLRMQGPLLMDQVLLSNSLNLLLQGYFQIVAGHQISFLLEFLEL